MITDANLHCNLRHSPGKERFHHKKQRGSEILGALRNIVDCEALHFKDTRAAEVLWEDESSFLALTTSCCVFHSMSQKLPEMKDCLKSIRNWMANHCLHLDSDKSQDLASAQFVSFSLNFDKPIRCGRRT